MSSTKKDELPRDILFLKSQHATLAAPESFLRNRGWEIRSFVNMRETISSVMQSQPNYILICADHPNTQIRLLPQLFQQKLGIQIIAYFDKYPSNAGPILEMMKTHYVLYPTVSGPAIERMVLKMQRDLQVVENRRKEIIANGGTPSDLINVKQGSLNEDPEMARRFAMQELQKLMKQENPAATVDPNPLIFLERNRGEKMNAEDAAKSDSSSAKETKSFNEYAPYLDSTEAESSGKRNDYPDIEYGGKGKGHNHAATDADAATTAVDRSIIGKGAQHALQEVHGAPASSGDDITVLEDGTRVACIIIQSSRFAGYLIAALGKNRILDTQFLKMISERLYAFLKKNGEEVQDKEPLDLSLQPVKFEAWALEQAEFLKKAQHGRDEITMAFFPFQQIEIGTQESTIAEMCTISIDDLADDAVLDFDIYLNLPVNNRNILYTAKGGAFYRKQKDRLKKSGVQRMHLSKADIPHLVKYRAKNYLNSRIDEFKTDKNEPE